MSLDQFPKDTNQDIYIEILNNIFAVVFNIELVLKLFAMEFN